LLDTSDFEIPVNETGTGNYIVENSPIGLGSY